MDDSSRRMTRVLFSPLPPVAVGQKTRVIRTCGYIEEPGRDGGCVSRSGTHDVNVQYCSCNHSLCNSAPRPAAPAALLLLPLLPALPLLVPPFDLQGLGVRRLLTRS